MKTSRNKAVTLITIILLSTMLVSIFAFEVNATNTPINIRTWTQVAVAPNPVGVNQVVNFVFWNTQAPPSGAIDPLSRWKFNVSVTNPNNVTTKLGTYTSNADGVAFASLTPTVVGNWSVSVEFPQTVYTLNNTAEEQIYTNDTFLASTGIARFTVQSSPVPASLLVQTPSGTLTDWLQLPGAGFQGSTAGSTAIGGITGRDEADWSNKGPETAHVMWTKPLGTDLGGVVGGSNIGVPGEQFFTGISYWMRMGGSSTIMDGKLYTQYPSGTSSGTAGNFWKIDLRNGSAVQTTTSTAPGTVYNGDGLSFFYSISSTTLTPKDPITLNNLGWTLTNVPSGTTIAGYNDAILRISAVTSGSYLNLTQWNSSKVIKPGLSGANNAGLSQYYDWNVTITQWNATSGAYDPAIIPTTQRTVLNAYRDNWLVMGNQTNGYNNNTITLWAIDLRPGHLGQVIGNYTLPRYYQYGPSPTGSYNFAGQYVLPDFCDEVHHVVCFAYMEERAWASLDMDTGKISLSESQAQMDYFGDMPNYVGLTSDAEHDMGGWCAYGRLYTAQYGGILYCYNTTTMKTMWTYGNEPVNQSLRIANTTATGAGNTYGFSPTFVGGIADGKIYLYTAEHSVNTPIYKGAKARCVDAYTGKELWTISAFCGAFYQQPPTMIPPAYGYLVYLNAYDQQLYALAKGPSATTVTATPDTVEGSKVLIKGTVLDTAAGANQTGIISRFPNGLACVSDDNMTDWMEYAYMQHPRPENVQGVNVTLSVITADGAVTDIGNITTDSTGYYNFLWSPPAAGTYTILASFTGTKSYYSSYAQNTFNVDSAPTATPTPTLKPANPVDTYILGLSGATIAIMIAAGAVIILILRKRIA